MAQIEIYKVKKTVDPKIREYGMFEFFGMGGPFPKNGYTIGQGLKNGRRGRLEICSGKWNVMGYKNIAGRSYKNER